MFPGKQAAPPVISLAVLLVTCLLHSVEDARANPDQPAAIIGLIMDDMGNHRDGGRRVAGLPGPIACSILPHTPYATELARLCHDMGKVVMLHVPMQPQARGVTGGPGLLHEEMGREQFLSALHSGLGSVPHVRGINNHMGSHLTRHLAYMQWVMDDIMTQGQLFFVDSYTSVSSVALKVALRNGIPAIGRDVFLDNDPNPASIRVQFERLIATARRDGYALGIGHPYKTTLALLELELPRLAADGIMLVSVEDLIRRAITAGDKNEGAWQAHLFPSPANSGN
ncbi:MAG: divergent polysaccharide deacetylase family protein [Gammaproteobacteria bacterium]